MDALGQVLLELGLDLSPVKETAKVVAATMGELNHLTDQYQTKTKLETESQLTRVRQLAQAAVQGATAAIAEEKKKQSVLASSTAELQKQLTQQKLSTEAVTAGLGVEEKKLVVLKQQTEARKAELLALKQEANEEQARLRAEQRQQREGGEGFGNRLGTALLRRGGLTSLAAGVAGGFIGGELAVAFIEKIVEQLKEITREAGSISLLDAQFRKLAQGSGMDADKMFTSMQLHTEGLVDKFHLLQAASAGLKSHMLKPQEVAEAMGAIVKVAEAQGKSAQQAVEAFSFALASGRAYGLARTVGIPGTLSRLPPPAPSGLTPFQRQSAEFKQQISIIKDYAQQLGELPATFEQTEKRMSVSFRNLLQSFGQGINESAGAQVFLHLLDQGSEKLLGLQAVAQSAGRAAGDAFGGIAAVFRMLVPLFDSLVATGKEWYELLRGFIVSATGFDHVAKSANETRKAFEEAHPVLVKIVGAFALMVGLTEKVASNVGAFVHSLKENENLIKMIGAVALAALGPEVAIGLGLIGMGVKRGAFNPDEQNRQAEEAENAPGAPGSTRFGANLPSTLGGRKNQKSGYFVTHTMIAPGKQPGTGDWEDQLIEQMNKYQNLLGDTGGAQIKVPNQTNLSEERKTAQLTLQLQLELAKQLLEARREQLQQEKALDDQAYRQGEEDLEQHMGAQLRIARESLRSQRALAQQDYQAKLEKAKEDYAVVQKQFAGIGSPVSKEEQNNYSTRLMLLYRAYVTQWETAGRQFEAEKTRIQKEGDTDRQSAAIKGIQDQLAAEKESIHTRQDLLQKSFGEEQIDPATYYARRIDLIHSESLAEIQAAYATYEAKAHNERSLAELRSSLRKADQGGQDQIDKLYEDKVRTTVGALKKTYGGTQQLASAQFGVAGALNDTESQRQTAQGALANLDDQRAALVDMLPVASQFPSLYNEILVQLQQITQEQIHWNDELDKIPTHLDNIGQGLGAVGSGIGSTFHQKFAQNLAQTIGSATVLFNPVTRSRLESGIAGQDALGKKINDPMDRFVTQITSSVSALTSFVDAILNAKTAVTGGIGGAISGAGFGQTIGGALGKIGGLGQLAGPIGAVAGAGVGAVLGIVSGSKQAKVTAQINQLNTTFKNIMYEFSENTNNLQATIQQIQGLLQQARSMQASSKKGSSQYQQAIDQYIDQLKQLQVQQQQTLRDMRQQIAILSEPTGAQSYLSDLKQILDQYRKFEGAAQTTQDLADATQYLTESMQGYETNLHTQLLQDNEQAINDALQLNDLLYQRNQMTIEYGQQVSQILSQGVLTRQMTRAQTAGTQIYQLDQQYIRQKEQIDEQISATSYKVQAEQQIFSLATTRVGLETQLLALQNEQTGLDMARIAALAALVSQLQSGDLSSGVVGQLIQSLQGVTTGVPGSQGSTTAQLEALFAQAYQNRAGMGFGPFRAQNL